MNTPRWTKSATASAVVAALAIGTGYALVASLADRLPAQVAVHWGPASPDRWLEPPAALSQMMALSGALVAVMLIASVLVVPALRHPLASLAGAMGVFLPLFTSVLTAAQGWLSAEEVGSGPVLAAVLVGSLLVAALVGVAIYRWGSPPRPEAPVVPAPVPSGAPRVELARGSRAVFVERIGLSPALIAVLVLAVLVPLLIAGLVDWWMAVIPLLLMVLVALFSTATVTIDERSLLIRSGLRVTLLRESMDQITSADVREVRPMAQYGGWGWRIGFDGSRGFVTKAGDALVVHRHGESDLVVTLDRPDEAAGLVNALKDRARS